MTPPAPPSRVPFWDNARFAAIVLVVLGHAIQRMTYGSDAAMAAYLLIYAFHMPLFALVSGYFSKSDPPGIRQLTRVITDLVIPYVIFETIWALVNWGWGRGFGLDYAQPAWTLWFLLALATFRVVLPYLALLRWPLLWTVVISVAAGYSPSVDSTFSLSRTLGLLPFFALGWWLRDRDVVARWGLLRDRGWVTYTLAAAVLVGAGAVAWAFVDVWHDTRLATWMFFRESYAALGADQWWAGLVRLALIGVALVLSAAFLALVPRRELSWTHLGRYTLYVYLLHSFVLFPLRQSGLITALRPDWVWLPVAVVASIAIAVVLSTGPVRRVFRPLIEPRAAWLFARRDRDGAATAG